MKRLLSILLVLVFIFSTVCACDNKGAESKPKTSSSDSQSSDVVSSDDVSSDVNSTEDNASNISTITPIDTPSEEDASSDETSTSSSLTEEEEGEKSAIQRMRGGINFEALQKGPKESTEYVFQREYWELVADAGFTNVRLPVQLQSYVVGEAPTYDLDIEAMRWLDVAINHGLDCGLIVILDFHNSNYDSDRECFLKVWEQVAERYQHYPEELFFELVNEPRDVSNDYLNTLQMDAYRIIRKTNPNRVIAFATNSFNSHLTLNNAKFPSYDANIIVSIHNYAIMEFTHAGMGGTHGAAKCDLSQDILDRVTSALEATAAFRNSKNIPCWISEWGAFQGGGNFYKESMEVYYKHFTSECVRLNLPYSVWEFNHGFGVYNWTEQKWNDYLFDNMTITW